MAVDLSWLWDLLKTISDAIAGFFGAIWAEVTKIVNTGQGVFAGLVAFGSQLWDAFIKGMETVGKWIAAAFNWIYEGLKSWAEVFGGWFNMAMGWIGSGISFVAQQLYNFGNWIYNSALFVWSWIVNTLTALWQGLINWFAGVATAIGSWWGSVISGVNTWFTNLLKTFRQKIITSITASIAITGAWKGAERILAPQKMSDLGYGLIGVLASPIIGGLVGEIVNAVIPSPSSGTYPLVPEISGLAYTPPPITVPTPTAPTMPELGTPPTQPALMVGLPLDKVISDKITYDVTMMTVDRTPLEKVEVDATVESIDATLTQTLEYELAVA